MDEVFPNLYVGTLNDAGDRSLLQDHSVERVVSLTYGDPETGFPDSVSVFHCAMMDGPRNDIEVFREAVEYAVSGLESGETVLVHCSRGASRSVCVAGTAAAIYNEIQVGTALVQVDERRDGSDPHHKVIQNALQVHRDLAECRLERTYHRNRSEER